MLIIAVQCERGQFRLFTVDHTDVIHVVALYCLNERSLSMNGIYFVGCYPPPDDRVL